MSAKTTVIIPNYNGIKYLENCIEKLLLAKENHEFQILVIENGSTDGSKEIAIGYKEEGKIDLIVFDENTGFTGAVNAGIESSNTEYVLLLNNDTEVTESFVLTLEQFMDHHPKAFGTSAKMLSLHEPDIIDDCGDLYCALGWAFGLGKGKNKSKYEKDAKIFSPCGGAAIYRKDVFEKIGMFDSMHFAYLEDIDVGYRSLIHGYQNYFCHDAIVYHAGSAVSGSRHNEFKVKLSSRNSIYLICKNMPVLQVIINLPFLLVGFLIKILFFTKKGLGKCYLKGLGNGFKMSFSKEGRKNWVHFNLKNISYYVKIQWYLWINMVRRVFG